MTIFDVDSGFGAPAGAKTLAANDTPVSSWDEYLQMTANADDTNQTRLEELGRGSILCARANGRYARSELHVFIRHVGKT